MGLEERVLGRTGLRVRALGLGGLFVSRYGSPDRVAAHRAICRALELGVNYIDTAPSYHDSEEALGEALHGVPADAYVLATKLGGRPTPFDPRDGAALRRSVEESLRLLRRDYVDVLLIHEPERPGQYDWWSDWARFDGPVNAVVADLQAAGKVRFSGLGGTTAYELAPIMATGRYDVVQSAFNYTLLWREALWAVFPEAARQRMGLIIGSPLEQGALARRYDEAVAHGARWLSPPRREQLRRLYALLDDLGLPLPEVALRFVLSHPQVSLTLTGARSIEEVELNVRAAEAGPLPPDVLARLQEIADLVPFRPTGEPAVLPFGRPYQGPGHVAAGMKWLEGR